MNSTKTENTYSLSFYLFCIAVVFVYLDFLRATFDETGLIFNSLIRMFSISSGPFFLFLTTIVALLEGQQRRLKKYYWVWLICAIFYFIILIFNGVLIHRNSFRLVALDTMMLMFFMPGILIGVKKYNWVGFDKLIRIIFFLNVINLMPYIGAYENFAQQIRANIISGFGQIPYFFWGGLSMWPYLYLTMKDRSLFDKTITIVGIILYFYFALIYLKRAPFVFLIFFAVLLLIANRANLNFRINFRAISIFAMSVILSLFVFNTIDIPSTTDRLGGRFVKGGSVINTLLQSDRLTYDVNLVATQLSGPEYIIGRGLGGVVRDVKGQYPEAQTPSLHNSAAWITLKGGLLFILIWYGGWLRLFIDFLSKKDNYSDKFFIPILPSLLLSWVFGFLNMTVAFLLLTMCAGRVMAKEETHSSF